MKFLEDLYQFLLTLLCLESSPTQETESEETEVELPSPWLHLREIVSISSNVVRSRVEVIDSGMLYPHYTNRWFNTARTVYVEEGQLLLRGHNGGIVPDAQYMYSDRLPYSKREHARNMAQLSGFAKDSAAYLEVYLQALLCNTDIRLVHILAGVNLGDGYPYQIYGYLGGQKTKEDEQEPDTELKKEGELETVYIKEDVALTNVRYINSDSIRTLHSDYANKRAAKEADASGYPEDSIEYRQAYLRAYLIRPNLEVVQILSGYNEEMEQEFQVFGYIEHKY